MTTEATHVVPSFAISGAGRGLGREIAIGFADKAYRVFGTARTAEEIGGSSIIGVIGPFTGGVLSAAG
jgi:NADP-dependent 3-hydroxy acid dehydrogenase YdfG